MRVAIVNDYEIVVRGMASVLKPYADRVAVVELDASLPVLRDVDVLLYDTFGQVQGDSVDVRGLGGGPGSRVVVFSWNVEPDLVRRALAAGAAGYVSKGIAADDLVASLERVAAGETITPEGTEPGDRFGSWPGNEAGLSPREAEVLALICQGLTNQDIAECAFIGANTIKTHIRSLYRKIDVTSRSQAVGWGLTHGFGPDRVRLGPQG
ncbi:response regulator transcription factor [soil metagenome]